MNAPLLGYVVLGCVYWTWILWGTLRLVRRVPVLRSEAPREPEQWGRLSVIVPACNEGPHLETAARTLLAQDYPDLELILVDDRSTDETGEIVDRLATADPRVRALHVTELPGGWLGKVHALNYGVELAAGEWMLMTDADVHFQPGVLRRAVAICEDRGLDHLAVAPDLKPAGFLLDAMVAAFLRTFCVAMRCWKVSDPGSRAYIGVGAFNLVRRAAYDRTDGFPWLRLEVADDVGLGLMLKRAGARSSLANGRGLVGVRWYHSLADMARGGEKGYASIGHCRLWRMAAVAAALLGMELAPLVAIVPLVGLGTVVGFGSPIGTVLLAAGLAMLAAAVASIVIIHRWTRFPLLPGLAFPLAAPIGAALLLRAGLLGAWRGGAVWRGTLYPSEALRRGSRLPFP
jgi:glycosyltransferase involved in cell wall biosynthesis